MEVELDLWLAEVDETLAELGRRWAGAEAASMLVEGRLAAVAKAETPADQLAGLVQLEAALRLLVAATRAVQEGVSAVTVLVQR